MDRKTVGSDDDIEDYPGNLYECRSMHSVKIMVIYNIFFFTHNGINIFNTFFVFSQKCINAYICSMSDEEMRSLDSNSIFAHVTTNVVVRER